MSDQREKLIEAFKESDEVELTDVQSLTEWQFKKSKGGVPLAGALAYKNSLPYLVGHSHELLLENFTENTPVGVGKEKEALFRVKDLRDGDKIIIYFEGSKISQAWVLSLNLINRGVSIFDHQQSWIKNNKWLQFTERVEKFFTIQKFYKALTPNIVVCPGLEPTLDPFSVELKINNKNEKMFLPTSPELHLKKIISQGVSEVFEITPCFRNDESGRQHQPEFTMLEWYRSFKNLNHIIKDIEKLISFVSPKGEQPNFDKTTMRELFKKYLDFNLTPKTTQQELYSLAVQLELRVSDEDSFDDIFFMIFMDKIEPHLGKEGVDFVFDYPPSQAALAKINKGGWADRFEMYWQGYEIANAFNELVCPEIQKKRFLEEQESRKGQGKEFIPIDEDFIESLYYGLPPTAGIAMGLERLFMACYGITNIQDVRPFQH